MRVPIEDLGTAGGLSPMPVRRIVVLERFEGIASVQHGELSAEETAQFALALLDDQRERPGSYTHLTLPTIYSV